MKIVVSALILICITITSCKQESAPVKNTETVMTHEREDTKEFAFKDGKFVSPRQKRAVIGEQ